MKIKQLMMENFRQFKDKQIINFSDQTDQNVTIIMGKNGAGKTGIFRAVLFSLFGDIKLR